MSCYFVAQIRIHNNEEYQKYLASVDEVFEKYNGKYLAVDTSPEVLEGTWSGGRVVLIEFPEEAELKRWYNSPEYRTILEYRLRSAECNSLMVRGLTT